MKKPMKKSGKSPVKDSGKVKMAAMRGGMPPGGSGKGGPESLPKGFGGGKVTDKGKK